MGVTGLVFHAADLSGGLPPTDAGDDTPRQGREGPVPVHDRLEVALVVRRGVREIPSARRETRAALTRRPVYSPASGARPPVAFPAVRPGTVVRAAVPPDIRPAASQDGSVDAGTATRPATAPTGAVDEEVTTGQGAAYGTDPVFCLPRTSVTGRPPRPAARRRLSPVTPEVEEVDDKVGDAVTPGA